MIRTIIIVVGYCLYLYWIYHPEVQDATLLKRIGYFRASQGLHKVAFYADRLNMIATERYKSLTEGLSNG